MNTYKQIRDSQYITFHSDVTQEWEYRAIQLKKLKNILLENQIQIFEALKKDLNKGEFESITSELLIIIEEINFFLKNGKKWCKPRKMMRSTTNFDGQGEVVNKPLGLVLIISPWNYPLQLSLVPLIGAIGSGNCAMIKLSEFTPNISKLITEMINTNFDSGYIYVAEGGVEETQELLDLEFDKIFFTGSSKVGKIVMEKAAKFLTPVALELGGKSPTIIDKNLSQKQLKDSIKRILWGKFLNGGQTCIAPDYILIHKDMEQEFIKLVPNVLKEFNKEKPLHKSVNLKHYTRLKNLLNDGEIVIGGNVDDEKLSIELTMIEPKNLDTELMKEEIFGSILPIITYSSIEEIKMLITKICAYPLAMYIFSTDHIFIDYFLKGIQFGGASVNDTISQILVHNTPFGGVRTSGMGNYQGYYSFECFSKLTTIFKKGFLFELPFRYPPYKKNINLIRGLLKKAFK